MAPNRAFAIVAVSALALVGGAPAAAQAPDGPRYDAPFFPGAAYDPAVPTGESILGFDIGRRAATHAQIERCFRAWDEASPRTALFEYARSHEGRPLYSMAVSSPANIERLDQIKRGMALLADPRASSPAEQDRLVENLPAVAWMAYSIHGDEMSGSDAALALAYHLTASVDAETRDLLENLVVIIDPMMNPDGRDRNIARIEQNRAATPNIDDQSLTHTGRWPWGRTNHYLFDLNRDWIFGVHPETRGRIRAAGEWRPLLFVDCHEMGSQDTYLFSPSREPVNIHLPQRRLHWWDVFAQSQAEAFDRYGWRYYTGEWNEEWYPGYSSSWAGYRGAVGILYEQASVQDDGVRLASGAVMTYRESVHHQAVSSLANLRTLREHKNALMREFVEERRRVVSPDGPFGDRTFAVRPSANRVRAERFAGLMLLQGIEVYRATEPFSADATDRLGRSVGAVEFPAGTLLIPNRQPEGHLAAALLDFDPRMTDEFLTEERRELLRFGRSKLYDVTAWNIPMMHDVDAFVLQSAPQAGVEPHRPLDAPSGVARPDPGVGFVIDGADDRSVAAAARLMESGVRVRVAARPTTFQGRDFARGSVVIARDDNPSFEDEAARRVDEVCAALGLPAEAIDTGLGVGNDVPDLGGEHFPLMERPRIAVLAGEPFSPYNAGETWHMIDHRLGVRASYLDPAALGYIDLRRYNVLIVPSGWGAEAEAHLEQIKAWVKAGGTLIAIDRAAGALAKEAHGLSAVRGISEALSDLDEYEMSVLREWEGRRTSVEGSGVWSYAADAGAEYPWTELADRPSKEELKRRDEWEALFMPQGAIVAARTDDRHWLTFGLRDYVPVVYNTANVLMAKGSVEAPVRVGVYSPSRRPEADAPEQTPNGAPSGEPVKKTERVGWAAPPAGQEVLVRMSGLLWPEASRRIAHAACVTREGVGDGQVILFAADPTFRGAAEGTTRVLGNAMVYGPGFGASHPIKP